MIINFFPLDLDYPFSIVDFILFTLECIWCISYLIYSLFKKPISLDKYRFRLYTLILMAILPLYHFIASFFNPNNNINVNNITFAYTYVFPQFILNLLCAAAYMHLIAFSNQLNITFIFTSKSSLFAKILLFTSIINSIITITLTFNFGSYIFIANYACSSIINDLFTIFFIIFPTFKMLISTLRLDSLKLMSRKTIILFVITVLFLLCIITRIILLIFISIREEKIDDTSDEAHKLLMFFEGGNFYSLAMLIFFIMYILYFIVQQFYLDSILESVEGATTSNTQGSLYVEASKHIE